MKFTKKIRERELKRQCKSLFICIYDVCKKVLNFEDEKSIKTGTNEIIKLFKYQLNGIITHQKSLKK
jgi:hypothetical protein